VLIEVDNSAYLQIRARIEPEAAFREWLLARTRSTSVGAGL
jgi:hypothetical protein